MEEYRKGQAGGISERTYWKNIGINTMEENRKGVSGGISERTKLKEDRKVQDGRI